MQHCPSYDWDRYVAREDGPWQVGERYQATSPKRQQCACCYGPIEPNAPHLRQDCHDEEGKFTSPIRMHADGECRPFLEEEEGSWVDAR